MQTNQDETRQVIIKQPYLKVHSFRENSAKCKHYFVITVTCTKKAYFAGTAEFARILKIIDNHFLKHRESDSAFKSFGNFFFNL